MPMVYTDDDSKCLLIGGIFSNMVQLVLASVCVTTLLVKRHFERPQRDWLIWFYDFMKQGFGSGLGHVTNIIISSRIAGSQGEVDECQWYFVVYITDATMGTFLNISMLIFSEHIAGKFHTDTAEALKNCGDYGDPPKMSIFGTQLLLWLAIVVVGKVIVFSVLFQVDQPLNFYVGLIFDHFEGQRHLELLVVMIIVPFLVNIVQFWVQDTFLKKDNAQEYSNVNYSLLSPQGVDSTDFDEHLENGKGDVGGIALMPMNAKTTARERSPRTPPSTPPRKGSR